MGNLKVPLGIIAVLALIYGAYLSLGSKSALDFANGKAAAENYLSACLGVKEGMGNSKKCVEFYNESAPKIFKSNQRADFLIFSKTLDFKDTYSELKKIIEINPSLNWTLKPYAEIINQAPQ
jgi:hypothetical protein